MTNPSISPTKIHVLMPSLEIMKPKILLYAHWMLWGKKAPLENKTTYKQKQEKAHTYTHTSTPYLFSLKKKKKTLKKEHMHTNTNEPFYWRKKKKNQNQSRSEHATVLLTIHKLHYDVLHKFLSPYMKVKTMIRICEQLFCLLFPSCYVQAQKANDKCQGPPRGNRNTGRQITDTYTLSKSMPVMVHMLQRSPHNKMSYSYFFMTYVLVVTSIWFIYFLSAAHYCVLIPLLATSARPQTVWTGQVWMESSVFQCFFHIKQTRKKYQIYPQIQVPPEMHFL